MHWRLGRLACQLSEVSALATLLCLLSAASAAAQCPLLPQECSCISNPRDLIIRCKQIDPNPIIKNLRNIHVTQLYFLNCTSPLTETLGSSPLRQFTASACSLQRLPANMFDSVRQTLYDINLSINGFNDLPQLGFLPVLKTLNLNSNHISKIPEKAFINFPSLENLILSQNNICSLESNALSEIKLNLQQLDLSSNCFQTLPAPNLRNCFKVKILDFSTNKIKTIGKLHFVNMPNLRELRLNSNEISTIDKMAFVNLPRLEQLMLHNNNITSLDVSQFEAFKELQIFDISKNKMIQAPFVKDFAKLRQLRFDDNAINHLDTLTFTNLPSIELISLQGNQISSIARNAFDALENLRILLLSNNFLTSIDQGTFDGVRFLQQLNLRNNRLMTVETNTFSSIPHIMSLDLSNNNISRISKGAFENLPKLFWLDLSNNKLTSFEPHTFDRKIANLVLGGNKIQCDSSIDWFITYLVANKIRTFLPFQPEITCTGPAQYAGYPLRDLMIKKANETFKPPSSTNSAASLLSALIPGFASTLQNKQNMQVFAPATARNSEQHYSNLNKATQSMNNNENIPNNVDIDTIIRSMPSLIVNVPGLGNVDISKLDPSLIKYVLQGGTIPGIPKETTDAIVKEFVAKMSRKSIESPFMNNVNTAPVERNKLKLPTNRIATEPVVPELSLDNLAANGKSPAASNVPLSFMQFLPPNYNISKIPSIVIQTLARGQIPDMSLLPQDLLQYLQIHSEKMIDMFSKQANNASLDELLSKLPSFQRPYLETFEPYDLNKINLEFHHTEEDEAKASHVRMLTAIALGLIGAVTLGVLGFLYLHIKKRRRGN